ncbi:MAG: YtxH domain-containing protein [Terracidiphilus sp.]
MKFLLGLLAGIVAGLMLAPASGSETRRRISEGANDLAESSRERVQQVSETAKQKARQVSNLAADKVQQASDYARQKAGDIGGDVGRHAEAATDALTEKIQRRTA